MPKIREIDGIKYWLDAEGSMRPESAVSKADKQKEEVIEGIFQAVFCAKENLQKFKAATQEALDGYIEKQRKRRRSMAGKGHIRSRITTERKRSSSLIRKSRNLTRSCSSQRRNSTNGSSRKRRTAMRTLPKSSRRLSRSIRRARSTSRFCSSCSDTTLRTRTSRRLRRLLNR